MSDQNQDDFGPLERGPAPPPPPPRKKAGVWTRVLLWILSVLVALAAIGAVAAWQGWEYVKRTYLTDIPPLPARETLYAVNRAPAIRFFDRDGNLIASRGPRFGDRVTLADLPKHVPQAFLAVEDRRFYEHGAVDLRAIARAAYVNWRAKRVVEGGSTLTQQLAKGLFLTPDQTLKRKIQEAVMAQRLEKMLTKDEVLELYLNRVYFGANTFGVDGAARTYFGKPAKDLTIAETALIASLPKAPSRLSLASHMDAALDRSHLVLARMLREGWITSAQYAQAIQEHPTLVATAQPNDGDFGWALDYATTEAIRLAGPNSPDLDVKLSIDSNLQRSAATTLRRVVGEAGPSAGVHEGAMVVLGLDGGIAAMVGGTDYAASTFNRAVQAKRQPGSSFKPFVYAAALEAGVLPSDRRVDAPIKFGDWAPQNYGGGYKGEMTVAAALAQSVNTVAAQLGSEVGPTAIGDLARRFGVSTIPPNPNLAIALGAYEVNVLEMVSGYQVLQQAGNRRAPYIIESIRTVGGDPVWTRQATGPSPVYDIGKASMMVHMMQGVVAHGTGTGAALEGWNVAGKTGTSQNYRDAWFIGFTPELIAGVWVGNDDEKPMARVTGGAIPARIWHDVMLSAHAGMTPHDFEWLVPDLVATEEPDPRNGFYEDMTREFARVGALAEAPLAETPPVPPPAPVPESAPEPPPAPVPAFAPAPPPAPRPAAAPTPPAPRQSLFPSKSSQPKTAPPRAVAPPSKAAPIKAAPTRTPPARTPPAKAAPTRPPQAAPPPRQPSGDEPWYLRLPSTETRPRSQPSEKATPY